MGSEEIDLRHYIEILWKWKLVIVLLTAIAVITSAVFSFFVLSPVYETKVTLLVANAAQNQQSIRPAGDSSVVDTVSRIPAMTLNTYQSQILSPFFLKKVIDNLGINDLTPTELASMVSATILKDTNLIEIRVQNTDKVLATEIANGIASSFVVFVSENNQERMAKSLEFLTEQQAALKEDVAQAYATLKSLQERPDNVAYLTREISSRSQTLMNLREDLVREQVQRALLEAGVSEIDKQLTLTPKTIANPDGTSNPVPNPAYLELQKTRDQKAVLLAESSAKVAGLQQEIANLSASLLAMEAKLTAVQNEEQQARAALDRIEETLSLLNAKMVEAQMAQSLNLGETSIDVISPALEPVSPVKPRKMLNMAVAGVLGGFTSVLLAFVLEYMDNTIKTPEDVQKHLGLGTLGSIPEFSHERSKRS